MREREYVCVYNWLWKVALRALSGVWRVLYIHSTHCTLLPYATASPF